MIEWTWALAAVCFAFYAGFKVGEAIMTEIFAQALRRHRDRQLRLRSENVPTKFHSSIEGGEYPPAL